jgi:hypothetical protein
MAASAHDFNPVLPPPIAAFPSANVTAFQVIRRNGTLSSGRRGVPDGARRTGRWGICADRRAACRYGEGDGASSDWVGTSDEGGRDGRDAMNER